MSHASKMTAAHMVAFALSISALILRPGAFIPAQQRGGSAPAPNPAGRIRSDQVRIIERESTLNEMKALPGGERRSPGELATLKQVGEDFARLQILNNEMTEMASKGGALEYKLFAGKAAETHKRAVRLKNNLVLPEAKQVDGNNSSRNQAKLQGAVAEEDIKAMISTLAERIKSFIANPYFRTPHLINPQHAEAASLDLRSVIEISNAVRKSTEKLKGR